MRHRFITFLTDFGLADDFVGTCHGVMKRLAPDVEIIEFYVAGTLLGVRPYCHNSHYWQVFCDTNKAIREVGAGNVWPVPAPHQMLLQRPA